MNGLLMKQSGDPEDGAFPSHGMAQGEWRSTRHPWYSILKDTINSGEGDCVKQMIGFQRAYSSSCLKLYNKVIICKVNYQKLGIRRFDKNLVGTLLFSV